MTKIYNYLNQEGSTKADHPVSECKKWGCRGIAPRYESYKSEPVKYTKEEHPPSMCKDFGCDAISILIDPNQNKN